MPRTRTNIEIDDDHLRRVMERYQLRTKTEAVDLALRTLADKPMSVDDIMAMHGAHAIGEVPPDHGPFG